MSKLRSNVRIVRRPLFQCMECGKLYYSEKSAAHAFHNRCSCGGCDIDIYAEHSSQERNKQPC